MDLKFVRLLWIPLISSLTFGISKQRYNKTWLRESGPIVSEDCLQRGYCEDVPNYPEEVAAQIIKQLEKQEHEERPAFTFSNEMTEVKIPLCKSRRQMLCPKAARDLYGNWRFILNQNENPLQCVEGDVCVEKAGQCEDFFTLSVPTYERRCQQQKAKVRLLSFDVYGRTKEDLYLVDCCCSCQPAKKRRLIY